MDKKMFRMKLQELLAMCPDEEEGGEAEHEPQDGQPKKSAAIDDGGQDSLTEAGESEDTFFPSGKTPDSKKRKLDVIVASMKKKMGK